MYTVCDINIHCRPPTKPYGLTVTIFTLIIIIIYTKYKEYTDSEFATTTMSLAITERDDPSVRCTKVVKTVNPGILTHVSIIITIIKTKYIFIYKN